MSPAPVILLVEDEYFQAKEFAEAVKRHGGVPLGPFPDIVRAREAVVAGGVDAAVLDVNLRGEWVFDLLPLLEDRNIPYCLATAYRTEMLPDRFHNAVIWEKPFDADLMVRRLLERGRSAT